MTDVWEEMIHAKAEQVRITHNFHKLAKVQGGYIILHVPLPFKLPLQDGFLYGWDPVAPRFLELIHYPDQGDWDQVERVGEPIFPRGGDIEKIKAMVSSSYTVARLGSSIPRDWIIPDAGDTDCTDQTWALRLGISARTESEVDGSADELLQNLLDDGLKALNLMIRAYRIVTDDVGIGTIENTFKLPFSLLYTLWDIRRSENLAFVLAA